MSEDPTEVDHQILLEPAHLFTRGEALSRPYPIPAVGGVYAWYFDAAPPGVPTAGTHRHADHYLLYVGISPKSPSADGLKASRQNLRMRIRYHYRGNAAGSTLRLTLGSVLADTLNIQLRRVGSGQRLTYSEGEAVLSVWMQEHARVCWVTTSRPWLVESYLIRMLTLPLNLDQNKHSSFHGALSGARAHQRSIARELPVVPK